MLHQRAEARKMIRRGETATAGKGMQGDAKGTFMVTRYRSQAASASLLETVSWPRSASAVREEMHSSQVEMARAKSLPSSCSLYRRGGRGSFRLVTGSTGLGLGARLGESPQIVDKGPLQLVREEDENQGV